MGLKTEVKRGRGIVTELKFECSGPCTHSMSKSGGCWVVARTVLYSVPASN